LERVDIFRFKNVVIDGVARFYLVPHTKSWKNTKLLKNVQRALKNTK
jgi:hypothetical protein